MGIGAKFLKFLVIALLFLAAAAPSHAADYYVATNGNNGNAGSQAAPWRTIAYAVGRMQAGDTTYVKDGVYNEGRIVFSRSGTASARITLMNAPGASPIINFGGGTDKIELYAGSRKPIGYITIEGFEIRRGNNGIKLNNTHDIVIRRNWIHDSSSQGILGNGKNILLDRNVINHNGDFADCARRAWRCNQQHGIYTTGNNWTITNNLIYDNLAMGIVVAGYAHCPNGGCYGGGGGQSKHYTDASYAGASNWLIANNTIAYNRYRVAISLWQPSTKNIKIINNIFYENSQADSGANGVYFSGCGGGHVVQNNIFYATRPGETLAMSGTSGWQGKYTASGNIVNTVNPGFVSAGATISGVPNFKLQPTSPAIDKGQNLSAVTWDHAGGKRPFGPTHDIGAYEYGAPPDSGSPPPNPTGGEETTAPIPENCPPVGIEAAGNPFAPGNGTDTDGTAPGGIASGAPTGPVYYVATNGNNNNAGTEASPWRSIAHAVGRMRAGDTTYVKSGVYREGMITFRRSGTASAPIRLLNAPGASPVIDFGVTESNNIKIGVQLYAGRGVPIGWITIEGFEIRSSFYGIKLNSSHDVVIRRNWIHHNVSQGILGSGKNILVDRNVINHNGDFGRCASGLKWRCNQVHGIYPTGTNWTIINNLIYDNLACGVHVAGYAHCPNGGCYGGGGGQQKKFPDASYAGASGFLIANNTIAYNNYCSGIILWQPATKNNRIINNILYENGQKRAIPAQGISFLNSGGGHEIRNNLCYATAPGPTACIAPAGAGKYTASGNILNTVNPGFVRAGATLSGVPDFDLQPTSPAIDKGLNLSPQVTNDFEAGKRPFGSAFDIGAFEYGATPGTDPGPSIPPGGGGGTAGTGGTGGITVPPGCPPPFVPDTYIQCIPPDP